MSQTKRAWKLQEFVAHGANVNCLAMGHKTARVMVTGGEDRRVNLWKAGKPNCIMSLAGHTTPVEAVRFGYNEEMVVAGSMSGALKIWDLQEAKILRTLTGHKSGIRSLDFHPFGDYVASGSLDCNIKLWDIRRKGCIYTYKGHTQVVNNIKFSPDGRWMASAGGDGLIKIWDLSAGKLLTDMKLHTAAVNVVEFHPNELLLASGSADRTVKFWDLESFQLVSSSEQDSTPVSSIHFHPDGTCLYSGTKDFLKVYGWEPAVCYDSVPLGWAEVADMAVAGDQLIGASFSKTNVSTFVVDLKKICPHGGEPQIPDPSSPKDVASVLHLTSSHGRKNYLTDRPPTQSSRQASIPKENLEEPQAPSPDQDDNESVADIQDPEDYREIFQPRSRIDRSPPRPPEPFQPPNDDVPEPEPIKQAPIPTKKPTPVVTQPKVQRVARPNSYPEPPPQERVPGPVSAPSQPTKPSAQKPTARDPSPTQVKAEDFLPERVPAPVSAPSHPTKPPVQKRTARDPLPTQVKAEDFLPAGAGAGSGEPSNKNMTEEGAIDMISRGHKTMVTVLSSRSRCLQTVRAMWGSRNTKTAIDAAISMNDQAVIVDVLNVLNAKSGLWSLDISACLLPHLNSLLASKYQDYVDIACESLKIVLKNFGPVIKGNMTAPPSIGVDISREERYRKCNACYKNLMDIRLVVDRKSSLSGKVGDTFRQLQILLGTLD